MRTVIAAICTALFLALAGALAAQQSDGATAPDYAAWQQVAERAEDAVEAGRASVEAFDRLRSEVSDWRGRFQAQLNANDSRLQTIRGQIEALGPPPEEGATEPPEIAARRAELTELRERLSTPRRTAEEAFSRANGIISEIDQIVRDRQADLLLERGPMPVNPALWPAALSDLTLSLGNMIAGVGQAWDNPTRRQTAQNNLPLVLLLLSIAAVLLARSRAWTERVAVRLAAREGDRSAGVAGFVVSLGQILFPILGLLALVRAIEATDLFGPRGAVLLQSLPAVGVTLFLSRWLGSRVFPPADEVETPLNLPPERRREGRYYALFLGIVLAILQLLSTLIDFDGYSDATVAVLVFPLIVLAALMLFRVGQLIKRHSRNETTTTADKVYRDRFLGLLGRAARLIAVISPVLAAAGYTTAAAALLFPAILSLALFAVVALLQGAVRDVYALMQRDQSDHDGLVPTLLGFLLLVAAVPVFALIWGARVTDLTELWARAQAGLTLGETTISPGSFFTLIIVFVIGYFLTRAFQGTLRNTLLPKTRIDPGGQVAIVSGVGYVGIFLAALIAITSAGLDLSSLAIVAGALSVGIGFGLQNIVSNFVSGIILLIERPISEGDWIEVGGRQGYVRSISVRSTRIETFDRSDVIVPNADFVSGAVTNFTRGNTVGRLIVPVGVAYGTDTKKVDKVLREIAEAHPMVLANPAPNVLFVNFGASSLDFEIRAILRDVNWVMSVGNDMRHQIAERFTAEGIEIPFAQTDIWLRNPETLRAAPEDGQGPPTPKPPTEEGT